MIQHEIDNDPGNRHIEPEREGPTGNLDMSIKSPFQCPIDSDQGQRENRRGQDGVGDQDREVESPNRSLPPEMDRPDVIVVREIGDQKEGGDRKGRPHTDLVGGDLLPPDEEVSDG